MRDLEGNPDAAPSVVGLVGLCLIAAVVFWLTLGDGGTRLSAALRTPSNPATARAQSQPVAASPIPLHCEPAQVQLTGAFESCASPTGHCDPAPGGAAGYYGVVTHLRDLRHMYAVQVAIDGGYHGPDGYQLSPWGEVGINAHDGIAKILMTDESGRARWQSTSGFLMISPSSRGTMVGVTFQRMGGAARTGGGAPALQLTASGSWSCGVN